MCLDVFLMGLEAEERVCLIKNYSWEQPTSYTLLSYDVSALGIANFKQQVIDRIKITEFAEKFAWQADLQDILQHNYQALVITDTKKQIQWLNAGFEQMTGYQYSEVIGKKPSFLQGKETEKEAVVLFREKIRQGKDFEASITNYRKNGEKYLCHVRIFPMYNAQNQISHYLALEQEIQ